ncbi:hypothetical protein [Pseudomonas sp. 37 R 15]|nr:hypothetical protein [Pseudomonas sp. 37 R 15]
MIALVTGNKLTAIVAVFGLFQQVAVEVVGVGGALAVEADFLSDQAVGVVVQLIGFADFVFDGGQQKASIVVAVLDLSAIGIDAAADQVQAVGVFVAGDVTEFIALGDDFSVGIVAEFSMSPIGLGQFQQAPYSVPLVLGQRAMLILPRNPPPQIVIAIALDPAIRKLLL